MIALIEMVVATGVTIFFWPSPSFCTATTFTNPNLLKRITSLDTALGSRLAAAARSAPDR